MRGRISSSSSRRYAPIATTGRLNVHFVRVQTDRVFVSGGYRAFNFVSRIMKIVIQETKFKGYF